MNNTQHTAKAIKIEVMSDHVIAKDLTITGQAAQIIIDGTL